ncbi:hypothetical protein [Nisaea nitritireducens]|uniref:hypothetical protein n=1 Tax=Nisaea nitritireducens TaxID=568392 RepID=UPI0018680017|nr:hypothetical protein [Nisaea nitritireducens]
MKDSLPGRDLFGRLFILPVLLTLFLTGCGEIPRPFSREPYAKPNIEFLLAPEAAGIYVEPIEGPVSWVGEAMAAALSQSLVKHNVIASASARNKRSYVLKGQGYQQLHIGQPAELVLDWELSDPSGKVIGEKRVSSVPPSAFWETPDAAHFKDISNQNAPGIAAWLLPQLETVAAAGLPPLYVDLIEGKAGSGNAILRQALLRTLRARGVAVENNGAIPDGILSLKGRIDIKPINSDTDIVSISWRLIDPAAREIGVIDQQNAVPSGSMEDNWVAASPLIADGALQGLLPLLRAYERQRVGEKPVTKRQ